jgi:diguanylate cyclase (GGDEF)-like protein
LTSDPDAFFGPNVIGNLTVLLLLLLTGALSVAVVYLIVRNQALSRRAAFDVLTGLANRMLLDTILDREIAQADRRGSPLCAAMIDLDHFKRVNDRYGHLQGDKVLVAVAEFLRNGIRARDVVGRWGGEEFLLILPDTDLSQATMVVERLRSNLASTPLPRVGTVTMSAGVAEFVANEGPASFIDRADQNLYRAKRAGRNQISACGVSDPLPSSRLTVATVSERGA